MSRVFSFPNPVNEIAARVVAGLVVATALAALFLGQRWLSIVLAAGFALRVGWGPRFDPFGLLATKVIAPRLGEPKLVAGPPKRFAQAIGLAFSLTAAVLFYAFDANAAGFIVLAALAAAATLESALGFCLGCQVFALLMKAGVIPEEVCESCNNIWADRTPPTVSA